MSLYPSLEDLKVDKVIQVWQAFVKVVLVTIVVPLIFKTGRGELLDFVFYSLWKGKEKVKCLSLTCISLWGRRIFLELGAALVFLCSAPCALHCSEVKIQSVDSELWLKNETQSCLELILCSFSLLKTSCQCLYTITKNPLLLNFCDCWGNGSRVSLYWVLKDVLCPLQNSMIKMRRLKTKQTKTTPVLTVQCLSWRFFF